MLTRENIALRAQIDEIQDVKKITQDDLNKIIIQLARFNDQEYLKRCEKKFPHLIIKTVEIAYGYALGGHLNECLSIVKSGLNQFEINKNIINGFEEAGFFKTEEHIIALLLLLKNSSLATKVVDYLSLEKCDEESILTKVDHLRKQIDQKKMDLTLKEALIWVKVQLIPQLSDWFLAENQLSQELTRDIFTLISTFATGLSIKETKELCEAYRMLRGKEEALLEKRDAQLQTKALTPQKINSDFVDEKKKLAFTKMLKQHLEGNVKNPSQLSVWLLAQNQLLKRIPYNVFISIASLVADLKHKEMIAFSQSFRTHYLKTSILLARQFADEKYKLNSNIFIKAFGQLNFFTDSGKTLHAELRKIEGLEKQLAKISHPN